MMIPCPSTRPTGFVVFMSFKKLTQPSAAALSPLSHAPSWPTIHPGVMIWSAVAMVTMIADVMYARRGDT